MDQSDKAIPEEFLACLENEPDAKGFFDQLSGSEKRYYIDWIYAAKKEETKVARIVEALSSLAKSKKFMQRNN